MINTERGLLDFTISRLPILPREKIYLSKVFEREGDISVLAKKDIESMLKRTIRVRDISMKDIQAQGEADWNNAKKHGIGVVAWYEDSYPPLLKEICDPPVLLYYRGALPKGSDDTIAVVGTRRPSPSGNSDAYNLCRTLARAGTVVVSGLALGIDAMAHRGSVDQGGVTVAVLGSGVDSIYPSSNRGLARRILEKGGAIISEYAPFTPPDKWHFPARNRIISGLCRAVVIVEAPRNSGALITARFALEQDRDLYITRPGLSSPLGEGIRDLEVQGAPVLENASSLIRSTYVR